MIKFHCPNCKQKLGVPDEYAGRRVRCKGCNFAFVVPGLNDDIPVFQKPSGPQPESSSGDLLSAEDIFGRPKQTIADSNRVAATDPDSSGEVDGKTPAHEDSDDGELKLAPQEELPPPDPKLEAIRQASRLRAQQELESEDSEKKKPKFAPVNEAVENPNWLWPFVFPLRGPAMGMIGIFIVCELLIFAMTVLSIIPCFALLIFIPLFAVWAYILWYLSLCVQTAADGKIRSPDILGENEGDFMDMFWRMIRLFLAVLECMAPVTIYMFWFTSRRGGSVDLRIEPGFWILFVTGLFLLPMTLLAVIMHDSASGLNPLTILEAVAKTFFRYLVLVACFAVPAAGIILINIFAGRLGFWFTLPAQVIILYFCIVGAAMLGRFFYANEKRLDWF